MLDAPQLRLCGFSLTGSRLGRVVGGIGDPAPKHRCCVDISGVEEHHYRRGVLCPLPPTSRPPRPGTASQARQSHSLHQLLRPAFNPIPSSLARFYLCQRTLEADGSRPAEDHGLGLVCLRRSLPSPSPSIDLRPWLPSYQKCRASHRGHTRPAQPHGAAHCTSPPQYDGRWQGARFVFQ